MPLLGLGCWKMEDAKQMVSLALQNGWRHIDSACDYGNEVEVGEVSHFFVFFPLPMPNTP